MILENNCIIIIPNEIVITMCKSYNKMYANKSDIE